MMNLRPIAIPAKQERFFLTMTSDLRVDPATRVDKVYTHAHLRHDRAENQTDRAASRRRRVVVVAARVTTTRPHRLAREMYVWTWRDGIAHDMFSDANWDFMHHHSAVPRERDFRLRNGDLLQQACVYNSTERTSTTRFGMSTETEMCIAYIDYSVPRNAPNLIRKQRAMWNGPLAPGVAVSSAVGPTPPAAGYRFPHT